MGGTITFGGVGSGIDTESIVTGLVTASSTQLNALKSRSTDTKAAVSSLSDVSSYLNTLKTAADALADSRSAQSFSATVAGDGVVATASGAALPGTFSIQVMNLAKEHRSYSDTQLSSSDALGQDGTLNIGVGSGLQTAIAVTVADSLQTITDKINAAGIKASASVFYDGSVYRLQLRGTDTGAANSLNVTETGTTLGLTKPANLFQAADDARVKIDGYTVTRPTNQIVGAIQGVTLAVTKETATATTVRVDSDPDAVGKKLKAVVDAYNNVVTKVHTLAGFGTVKGTSVVLSGDATLRALTSSMSNSLLSTISGSGKYQTLSSVGVSLNRDGTLALDQDKLSKAIAADGGSVSAVLAGAGSGSGAMDMMSNLISSFSKAGTGTLAMKKTSLDTRAKALDASATRESDRLQLYAETLRKQFTLMDQSVAASHNDLSYLSKLYG